MGVKGWCLIPLVLVPSLAPAKPAASRPADFAIERETIRVRGVGAPPLHAPSTEIGRVGAERTARADAGKRLMRGLAALPQARLGCKDATKLPSADQAVEQAKVGSIEWGSDGSVALVLEVQVKDLVGGRVKMGSGPGPQPSLFSGGDCASTSALLQGDAF